MATSDGLDGNQQQKPVTIRDVAKLAGVSMATVSRVVNGSTQVDPQLAERVRTAIANLKYQPNRAARALASNRSALLGLLVTDIQNQFFMDLMRGVEDVAQQNGYLLVVCNTADNRQKEQQYLEVLAAESIAGVVIVPTQELPPALELLQARNIPIIAVDRRIRDRSIDAVLIDNVAAAKEAVTHLIVNGYRRIGIITGPKSTTTGNERLQGYRQALQEAGLVPDPALELRGLFDEASGQHLTHKLLDLDPPIDALFTANNRLTVGALRTLHARHKRVPDDIALAGFDNIYWAIPGLVSITTIAQPAYELGTTSATRLLQRLRQSDTLARQEIILQHQFIIGDSSKPASNPSFT
ncbi:MAG TPA: LacI family DNA-binding transcriptional regulator [Ktedonobacteraceae bacterium]|nr:LacI family DNA-binding transcriptional regulator [Ktedonobacteraceae bacterium]